MSRAGWLFTVGLLGTISCSIAGPAAAATPGGHELAGAAPAGAGRSAEPPGLGRGATPPAPGRVLVRVAGGSGITLGDAVTRWAETHGPTSADPINTATCRDFLDLLADEAALSEAAQRAALPWTPADSAEHRRLLDRLVMRAALDSVLEATRRATGAIGASAESLGVLARERVVASLEAQFDDAGVSHLAEAFRALPQPVADSSLSAQIRMLGEVPKLDATEGRRVLVRSSLGTVVARDVVDAWSKIGIAYRPRIQTAAQVRDLVENVLFERALREAAERTGAAGRPEFRSALDEHARGLALSRYVDREVLSAIPADSAAMRAYFAAHRDDWTLPLRVRGIRLSLDDRRAAVRMAVELADAAAAETLDARARRSGIVYDFEATATSDTALFRRAILAGPGAVVGPVGEGGAWWVARIGEVVPGRSRQFEEVRADVAQRWFEAEAERRSRTLAGRLRHAGRVTVAPGAAEILAAALREMQRSAGADVNQP